LCFQLTWCGWAGTGGHWSCHCRRAPVPGSDRAGRVSNSPYRLAIITVALVVAARLYIVVMAPRVGMLIVAGASNREIIVALCITQAWLYTVFVPRRGTLRLAVLLQAPILTLQIGMARTSSSRLSSSSDRAVIGSIPRRICRRPPWWGCRYLCRALLPDLLRRVLSSAAASTAAPALSSMLISLFIGDRAGVATGGPVSPPSNDSSLNARSVSRPPPSPAFWHCRYVSQARQMSFPC